MGIVSEFMLDRNDAVLVVIDVQERLCQAMDEKILGALTRRIAILQEAAQEMQIPLLATEQYVKGLGEILEELKGRLCTPAIEKMTFSCCGETTFPEELRKIGRKQIIVTGMETHVCVLQTVLQLLEAGYIVHVVADAVMSRKKENWRIALGIAQQAGAVITSTETVLFQLLRVAGSEEFKKLSKLVR
jgi:nicotinamidase-related amidase